MPQSDSQKVDAVRQLVNAVANSSKNGSGSVSRKEKACAREVLTNSLGRSPTNEEVEAALGD